MPVNQAHRTIIEHAISTCPVEAANDEQRIRMIAWELAWLTAYISRRTTGDCLQPWITHDSMLSPTS
jgi:hypothetical protein